MDKNTITGMILMGLVIFGFMWLNQPSPEEMEAQRKQQAEQAEREKRNTAATAVNDIFGDTLSTADVNRLSLVTSSYGTTDANGVSKFSDGIVNTSVDNGKLSGTVAVSDTILSIENVIENRTLSPLYSQAVKAIQTAINNASRYRNFASHLSGKDSTVTLENELLRIDFSTKGGIISAATLKDYLAYDSTNVVLMNAATDSYSFILNATDTRYDTKDFYFTPQLVNDTTLVMSLDLNGAEFAIRYTLPSNSYLVKMELLQNNMSNVIPNNITDMGFNWTQKMARQEKGRMFEERNSTIYYKYASDSGDVDYLTETSADDKKLSDRIKWIGFKNQFFSSVIIPDKHFLDANLESKPFEKGSLDDANYLKDLKAYANLDYSSELSNLASFHFFFGPNKYPLLSSYDEKISPDEDLKLTNLIPLGWSFFRWINTLLIIPIFNFLGNFISNYGIIILLLTIIVKIILFPFTYKSMISQAKMRILAPDIKAINDKYPGQENAMVRQQKTMQLYSQAGASPFSGCLPIMLQMPILFAMFTFFPSCIDLRGESFLWVKDLSAPDAIISWDAQIPFITNYFGNHISLFCLLMTVTNLLNTRISMQNQPGGTQMPGMKFMMYVMPLMFLVFFNNYAAGLSYYYFVSLLITIIQTYVFRHMVNEDKLRAVMAENAKKPKKKSGFMARLEEAQRQQQAAMRAQQAQQNKKKR